MRGQLSVMEEEKLVDAVRSFPCLWQSVVEATRTPGPRRMQAK